MSIASYFQSLKEKILGKYLKSIVQHGLTALGAVLVSCGIVEPDDVANFIDCNTAIITGAIVYIVGQIWSLSNKK